ncbi:hypothetical protein NQZ68_009284 [Dissostichus eleginoides]|nr:hypothetical protein NQZ68_009284 [Dissostichus eleginoides]
MCLVVSARSLIQGETEQTTGWVPGQEPETSSDTLLSASERFWSHCLRYQDHSHGVNGSPCLRPSDGSSIPFISAPSSASPPLTRTPQVMFLGLAWLHSVLC